MSVFVRRSPSLIFCTYPSCHVIARYVVLPAPVSSSSVDSVCMDVSSGAASPLSSDGTTSGSDEKLSSRSSTASAFSTYEDSFSSATGEETEESVSSFGSDTTVSVSTASAISLLSSAYTVSGASSSLVYPPSAYVGAAKSSTKCRMRSNASILLRIMTKSPSNHLSFYAKAFLNYKYRKIFFLTTSYLCKR